MHFAQQSYEHLDRSSFELDDISAISRSESRRYYQIRQPSADHLDTTPLRNAGGHEEDHDGVGKNARRGCSKFTGWRFGMNASAWTALFICLTNVIMAIVLARATTIVEGVGTPYTGPCDKVGNIGLVVHLVINILSSLLLAASNYSMQCLAAPTRSECSTAHSRYDWLDVGVNSMRNLRKIGWRRTLLWTILGISSLPIHLLYNSVFFEVLSTNEYNVVVVNPSFFNDWAKSPFLVNMIDPLPASLTQGSICSIDGRNLTYDNIQNDVRDCLSSCHMDDCGSPTSATGPPYDTSLLGDQILERCFNQSSCAVIHTNGSTSTLDLTAVANDIDWPLWKDCHFSTCTFLKRGAALENPSISDLWHDCYPSAIIDRVEVSRFSSITAFQRDKYAKNKANWQNLTLTQCLAEYHKDVVSKWNNVFVVISDHDYTVYNSQGPGVYDSFSSSSDAETAAEGPEGKQYTWFDLLFQRTSGADSRTILDNPSTYNGPVKYCVAEKHDDTCRLQFSSTLLAVVIVCNALKVVSMFVAVFWTREQPLVVMGDAIHSFLMHPDDTTRGYCFTTTKTLTARRRARQNSGSVPVASTTARVRSKRLFRSIDTAQLCGSLGFILLFLAAALALLGFSIQSAQFYIRDGSSIWTPSRDVKTGLTLPNIYDPARGPPALMSAVLLANTPQLVLSIAYLLYNNMLTVMLRHREWMSFSTPAAPQSLRVTNPSGQQRTSYFLHVPFKYGIPLLIASTLLHWMVSASFFLVRINGYAQGIADPKAVMTTLGYSPLWILLSILLGLVVLSGMMVVGFRRFRTAMPTNSSNSFIIAASCHNSKADSKAALGLIHWGALAESKDEVGHCTFTSLPVQDPGSLGRFD